MSDPFHAAQALRILVVAETGMAAQAIVQRLGTEFEGAVRVSIEPGRAVADIAEAGPDVVLLVLAPLAAAERQARALRANVAAAGTPIVLVLCGAGELAAT